jgi:hypothetical protein
MIGGHLTTGRKEILSMVSCVMNPDTPAVLDSRRLDTVLVARVVATVVATSVELPTTITSTSQACDFLFS